MGADVGRVADHLGLGEPCSALVRLAGGSSASSWRLDTVLGSWIVKTVPAAEDWQLHAMRVSATLERAAHATGVAMPAPVEPRDEAVGYWTRLADGSFARATARVEVTGPTIVHTGLAAWVGATLAKIDRLALPADPTAEAAYPVHPVADWTSWLPRATSADVLTTAQAHDLLAIVAEATTLVQAALATRPTFQLAHRDVSRHNILLTADGPVLIDFDHAGPEVPWWDVVHHIFDLACWPPGRAQPQPELVRAAIGTYLETGGTPGPANPVALTGILAAALGSLAYNLWLAAGLRPAEPHRRSIATDVVHRTIGKLATVIGSADHWTKLLQ